MGAWGVKPFDNDSALDWLGPIEDFAAKRIETTLKTFKHGRDYHEAIAAAALLLELTAHHADGSPLCLCYHATLKTNLYALATAVIEAIQKDAKWIADWKHPWKAVAILRRLHHRLALRATAEKKRQEKKKLRIIVRRSGKPGKRTPRKTRRVA